MPISAINPGAPHLASEMWVSSWTRKLTFASALAFCFLSTTAHAALKTFFVASHGAKYDGITLDTKAIQQTLNAAAKFGDTVTFPAGTYLTGSIFIKSNVTFLGSQNIADYPMMPSRIAGIEMTWSFLH
jgi:polygalacturonase